MKTDNKSNSHHQRKDAQGGFRNNNRGNKPSQSKKNKGFFRDVPETCKKGQQQRPEGGPRGAFPPGKRGPGVQKTTTFKPKRPDNRHEQKHTRNDRNRNTGGPHKGQHNDMKRDGGTPARNGEQTTKLFQNKPEKINYCLAPERLEAQSKAIKHFERQDREKVFQRRKEERNRVHTLMTKKTRKGQPVMQGRMELLFEKVKKTMGVQ